jgi:hypothetical protein
LGEQMTRRFVRPVLVAVLVSLIGATALAQRGGYRGGINSYQGNTPYDGRFVFVRMAYPTSGRGDAAWAHDYPDGESRFLRMFTHVSNVPAHVNTSAIMSFGDPDIFKFPVLYFVEPGPWDMTDAEVVNLRSYLQKGGFLIVDDFPRRAWGNFEFQMSRVFPEGRFQELDISHPIFHCFFEIDTLNLPVVYTNLGGAPVFLGLFDENNQKKRMQVMVNFQNDISEYWEFSESSWKPISESNEAFKFGINEFIYGITH